MVNSIQQVIDVTHRARLAWVMAGALQFLLVLTCAPGFAEEPEYLKTATLSRQLHRWVTLEVIEGRIEATSRYFGQSVRSSSLSNQRVEKMSISTLNDVSTLEYSFITPQVNVQVEASSKGSFVIQVEPKGDDFPAVSLNQQPGLPLELQVDDLTAEAPTLWHLLLLYPDVMEEHAVPLLEHLRPRWRLAANAEQVEAAIFSLATAVRDEDREQWAAWVQELGSPEFAVRESADLALRRVGPRALSFLYGLDEGKLDAEQRFRIRRIKRTLDGSSLEDSPTRVARGMLRDKDVWLALLNRPDLVRRQAAKQQLEEILGQPVDFDPDADEEAREKQIDKLKAQLKSLPKAADEAP